MIAQNRIRSNAIGESTTNQRLPPPPHSRNGAKAARLRLAAHSSTRAIAPSTTVSSLAQTNHGFCGVPRQTVAHIVTRPPTPRTHHDSMVTTVTTASHPHARVAVAHYANSSPQRASASRRGSSSFDSTQRRKRPLHAPAKACSNPTSRSTTTSTLHEPHGPIGIHFLKSSASQHPCTKSSMYARIGRKVLRPQSKSEGQTRALRPSKPTQTNTLSQFFRFNSSVSVRPQLRTRCDLHRSC